MQDAPHAQLKGSILAGYARYLREHQRLDAICAEVPPETAALLRAPPLAISWVDTRHARDVLDAVERLHGLDEVRRLGTVSLNEGLFRLLRPMLAGLVRASGASPHALFARFETVVGAAVRGYVVRYREQGARVGAMELRSCGIADSRAGLVGGWEMALALVLELAGSRGAVHLQSYEVRGEDTFSTFALRWDARSMRP